MTILNNIQRPDAAHLHAYVQGYHNRYFNKKKDIHIYMFYNDMMEIGSLDHDIETNQTGMLLLLWWWCEC